MRQPDSARLSLLQDPKLRAKLSMEVQNPSVRELLDRVQNATGLPLTLDRNLARHQPEYGHIEFREIPAFAVMDLVAKTQLVDGRWQKATNGYRLTATASLSEGPQAAGWWGGALGQALLLGLPELVLLFGVALYWRRRRRLPAQGAAKPSSAEGKTRGIIPEVSR